MITLTPLVGTMSWIQINVSHLDKEHMQNDSSTSQRAKELCWSYLETRWQIMLWACLRKIILLGDLENGWGRIESKLC